MNEIYNRLKNKIKSIPIIYLTLICIRKNILFISRNLIRFMRVRIANYFGLVDATKSIRAFCPSSAGSHHLLSDLTILSVNQTFPFLAILIKNVISTETKKYSIEEFCISSIDKREAEIEFKNKLDMYGSDKASVHNYHLVYSYILSDRAAVTGLLEIGIGSNNTDIVSNMSRAGKPGASLRAFRDFLPNAMIYGADFDDKILFQEEHIRTFFVDQTNPATLEQLSHSVPDELDLIIDDGLHAPNANIATLTFALPKLKSDKGGGWLIIEDIHKSALPIWEVVSAILPENMYKSYIISTKSAYMFACHKISRER